MKAKDIKKVVKENYGRIARGSESCCAPTCGCGAKPRQRGERNPAEWRDGGAPLSGTISKSIGYSDKDIDAVPAGANLGLGCGNPIALASLKPGEIVLDLGSGAGFDCFLAAQKVGPRGRVIGVDMTPEMVTKAQTNARKGNYRNVEFRLGEIEKLPLDDASVDVIISNCVINLSPDKPAVFKEAFRVLKPGGRIMVSDIVLTKPLPKAVLQSVGAYVGCLAGATMKDSYLGAIKSAGFGNIRIIDEAAFPIKYMANDPTAQALIKTFNISNKIIKDASGSVVSVKVTAAKPLLAVQAKRVTARLS